MGNNYSINKANEFIKNQAEMVNKKYFPDFHLAPNVGWMNDPNGVVYYQDEYHLFYQHFPYESQWGPMHWGHAKSKDGLHWEYLPVALAPDQKYDEGGCFSGSAIEKDGVLYLMYTGHLPHEENEDLTRQNQNIAYSTDGITFEKYKSNPVISEKDIPAGSSIVDFRDPKVIEKDGVYYCVIGSKTKDNKGQVLLYKSEDLLSWEYVSVVFEHNEYLGSMVECPDFLLFEKNQVFILSAMDYTDSVTGEYYPHISWIIQGEMNWSTYKFEMTQIDEMDKGLDFYAPQSAQVGSSYVAFAWMQGWNRTLPTHDGNHNWAGQMTIPRTVSEENGDIVVSYLAKIEDKIHISSKLENVVLTDDYKVDADAQYLKLKIDKLNTDKLTVAFSNKIEEQVTVELSYSGLLFSREGTKLKIKDVNDIEFSKSKKIELVSPESIDIEIFIDKSSVEIFVNGIYSSSNTFYMREPISEISLHSEGSQKINTIITGNIVV